MTMLEQLVEKARSLRPEQQKELLEHAERLERERGDPIQRESLWGACAGMGEELSLEDFQQIRREMWANFPRDIEL